MTNYERIFSKMGYGIETVAKALNDGKGRCNFCNKHPESCSHNCLEGIKEWLLKEAEE